MNVYSSGLVRYGLYEQVVFISRWSLYAGGSYIRFDCIIALTQGVGCLGSITKSLTKLTKVKRSMGLHTLPRVL